MFLGPRDCTHERSENSKTLILTALLRSSSKLCSFSLCLSRRLLNLPYLTWRIPSTRFDCVIFLSSLCLVSVAPLHSCYALSRFALPCLAFLPCLLALPRLASPCLALPCLIFCLVLPCLGMPYPVLSWLPCLTLSCCVLFSSCLALSYLASCSLNVTRCSLSLLSLLVPGGFYPRP
jgi:hypothetical protein